MKLSTEELAEVAEKFDIDPRMLRAVASVESGGTGFLLDGRLKILFERHHMRKRLMARSIDPGPLSAARPDLCSSASGGYGKGGAHQWVRIEAILDWASAHAPERFESYKKAAYEACSWGAFQIMGWHYGSVGFENVFSLKHHLEKGHKEQLEVICRWMSENGLMNKLKDKDWAAFARGYNGAGYAKNNYDVKLRTSYEGE